MNAVLIAQIGSRAIQIGSAAVPVIEAIVRVLRAQPDHDVRTVDEILADIQAAQAAADRIEATAIAELGDAAPI